jgi:uncharacterized membrane protein YjjP (DUF1212 family)
MQPVQSAVVDTAVEAALLVMRNGGSTAAAERSFTNVVTGYGLQGVTAVWRLDFIAASSTVDGESATVVRSVGPIGVNLIRAAEVAALSERVAKGEVELPVLDAEIARVQKISTPYNRWLTVLAAAIIGAGLSQFAGGDWGSLPVAAVAAGVGQILRSVMQARKYPAATVTLICGLLSAGIASTALRLGFSDVPPVTLIASVVYLAPGLPLINGFVDMTSHKYLLVGIERIINAVFLFTILAICIALAYTVIT